VVAHQIDLPHKSKRNLEFLHWFLFNPPFWSMALVHLGVNPWKDLEYMVYQLKYDSVHKTFGGHWVMTRFWWGVMTESWKGWLIQSTFFRETMCCGNSYHTSRTSGYCFACRKLFTTPMTSHSTTHRKFCNSCLKTRLLHQGRKYFGINGFENMMFSSEIDEDEAVDCPTLIIEGSIVIDSPLNIECSRCNENAIGSYKVNSYCRKCLQNRTGM